MDFDLIKPALIAAFTEVAVKQITNASGEFDEEHIKWEAEWDTRDGRFMHPGQGLGVYLTITSTNGVGEDEITYEMLDTGIARGLVESGAKDLFEVSEGLRRVVVQVKVVSALDDDATDAFESAERIRGGMKWQKVTDILDAAGLKFEGLGPANRFTMNVDDRGWSVAVMSATFLTTTGKQINPNPVGFIEYVRITTHINVGGPDGELPAPPNLNDELMPTEARAQGHAAFGITATATLQA